MAKYILFVNTPDTENTCIGIAESDDELNANHESTSAKVITVSDSDFLAVQNDTKFPKSFNSSDEITWYDNDPNTWVTEDGSPHPFPFNNADEFKAALQPISDTIGSWLEINQSHALHSWWTTYKSAVDTNIANASSKTYPINTTWGQYCVDNSIPYKHILQLP